MLFLLVFLSTGPLSDWMTFQGLRRAFRRTRLAQYRRVLKVAYWVITIGFLAVLFGLPAGERYGLWTLGSHTVHQIIGVYVVVYAGKVGYMAWVLLPRLPGEFGLKGRKGGEAGQKQQEQTISRREFISRTGVLAAGVPFYIFIRGITHGRYQFRVVEQEVFSPRLPLALDGLRITQLSDLHMGSFDSQDAVAAGLRLANAQKSDLLLFTGDAVNSASVELDAWQDLLAELAAPMGVYSVRGNHDYGLYAHWPNEAARHADNARLADLQRQLGWHLLEDEHVYLQHRGGKMALVGCHNWSNMSERYRFADLDAATKGLSPDYFTLLMSHDPSHWDAHVRAYDHRFDLTLAGHTHGMQFAVNIADWELSPISLLYPRWAGLYQEPEGQLYVNRGFGFVGYPGRVGVPPEITVLTLRRA